MFPGDKEPSFAVMFGGSEDGEALVGRVVGKVGGRLLDPLDDPSLIERFGDKQAA
jgi:hypothetical protein